MRICVLALLSLLTAPAFAQATFAETVWTWAVIGGKFQLIQIEGAQIDKTFSPPKVRIGPVPTLQAGSGIVLTAQPDGKTTINVNDAVILYRTQAPTAPGSCGAQGSGAIAADTQYIYLCVPNGAGGFVWARSPLQTAW
jgi:hypothetical protein